VADLKRSEVGNQATEQGAFDAGADPSQINVSGIPHSRPHVEVDAEYVDGDINIYPKCSNLDIRAPESFYRGLGDLQEGPMDIMNAQLLDEPNEVGLEIRRVNGVEIEARPERFMEISLRSPRESLVWYGYSPDGLSAVLGDRVDVLKDVLESAYSCKSCKGKGHDPEVMCVLCKGAKYEIAKDNTKVPCRGCKVLGFGMEQVHSSGFMKCALCQSNNVGTGWRAGIVIPEQAQQEAITGIVVSVGPECRLLKIGDRVVHSKYAGHTLKMSEDNSIVTMRESEVLKILRQR
jgi:co-chaperonin GroES (HSP10)